MNSCVFRHVNLNLFLIVAGEHIDNVDCVFWIVTLFNPVGGYQCAGVYCFHLQGNLPIDQLRSS